MKTPSSTSLIAGLVVASLGLLPVALTLMDFGGEAVADTTTTSTSIPAAQPPTTMVEIEPPQLEGVDARVSRVLYAYGAAQGVEPGSSADLEDPIVKVLAYYDVTLAVPEDQP